MYENNIEDIKKASFRRQWGNGKVNRKQQADLYGA